MVLICIKSYRMVKEIKEISFDSNTESLKEDYLDIIEGVKADVMYTVQYEDTKMRRQDELKRGHKVPIMEDYYIPIKLLDGVDCKILLHIGASKSFMSKTLYLNCSLHLYQTMNILVGNGQYVGVLFLVPVVINLQGHRFEVNTLVSQTCDNMDMAIGKCVPNRRNN